MSGSSVLRRGWRLLAPLGDAAVFYSSLFLALALRGISLPAPATVWPAFVQFSPLFALWLGIMRMLDLYDLRAIRQFPTLVQNLLVSSIVTWVVGTTYFYLAETWTSFTPKTHLLLTILFSHCLTLLTRRGLLRLFDYRLLDQRLVFLGDSGHARQVQEDLERLSHETGFTPVPWSWPGVDLVVADTRWVDEHWDQVKGIVLEAISRRVPLVSFESFYEGLFGKVSPEFAGRPSWALDFVLPAKASFYARAKRLFDVAAAAFLLLALSPALAALALAVLAADGWPVLYGQRRVGLLCREFTLWKFRTMARAADQDGPFASARVGDGRNTRLGGWLRRLRLDELPQLWNVLRGEMSLVGPRPEWTEEVEVLERSIPNYHLRHLVPPGITGWAQVYFRATNNLRDSIEKLHYDLFYLKYFSFGLDVSILLKTLKRVLVNDHRVQSLPSLSPRPLELKSHWVRDLSSAAGRAPN